MSVHVSTAIERFFYLTWLRMFQAKNTTDRKNETINVTNKHRHQNKRMVNEIKRTKQNKQTKKGKVKMR